MAAIVTFDGPNRRIIEISASGDNSLDVDEIYSEWKIWAQASNNLGLAIAFETVGGDETPTGQIGSTFFLANGWKIRPAELDHELTLVGNLFSRLDAAVVPTLGGYTVLVNIERSNLVDQFSTLATKNLIYPLYAGI